MKFQMAPTAWSTEGREEMKLQEIGIYSPQDAHTVAGSEMAFPLQNFQAEGTV